MSPRPSLSGHQPTSGEPPHQHPVISALEPQQMTVSVWFRGTGSPGAYKYLVAKGGEACTTASYAIQTGYNGGLWFYIWDGDYQLGSGMADQSVWDGRWHHAATPGTRRWRSSTSTAA